MSGKKLIAVSWWTFAYLLVSGALFTFTSMGDCLPGSEGSACRAQSITFSNVLLGVAVLTYAALTWLLFLRRR